MKAEAQPTNGVTRESGLATANGCCLRRFVRGHNHVTLYNADCLDVLPTLPPVDSVISDPPYGMNLDTDFSGMNGWSGKGNKYERIIGDDQPFDPKPWLKVGKTQVLWGAQYFRSEEHTSELQSRQ